MTEILFSNGNTSKQPSLGDPDKRATALQLKRARASRQKPWVASPMQAVARSCRCLAACLSQQQAMAYNLLMQRLCGRSCGGQDAIARLFPCTDSLDPSSSFFFVLFLGFLFPFSLFPFLPLFFSFLFHSFFVMMSSGAESRAWSWCPSPLLLLLLLLEAIRLGHSAACRPVERGSSLQPPAEQHQPLVDGCG